MPRGKAKVNQWSVLNSTDLSRFDKPSAELVLEMSTAGWTGRISQRGHAILRAPDGVTTSSISPKHDSNPGRLRMARSDFLRWQKTQGLGSNEHPHLVALPPVPPETVIVCEEPDCGKTFGSLQARAAHRKAHRGWVTCPVCHTPTRSMGQHVRYHHPHLRDNGVALPDAAPAPEPSEEPQEPVGRAEASPPVVVPAVAVSAPSEAPAAQEEQIEPEPPRSVEVVPEPDEADPVSEVPSNLEAMDALLTVLTENERLRALVHDLQRRLAERHVR